MSEQAEFRVRGRWVSMLTHPRCVHHIALADACDACALAPVKVAEDPRIIATLEVKLATALKELDVAKQQGARWFDDRNALADLLKVEQDKTAALELAARAAPAPIPEPPPTRPDSDSSKSKSEAPRRRTGSK